MSCFYCQENFVLNENGCCVCCFNKYEAEDVWYCAICLTSTYTLNENCCYDCFNKTSEDMKVCQYCHMVVTVYEFIDNEGCLGCVEGINRNKND